MREEPDSDFVYKPELPWGSLVPCMRTTSTVVHLCERLKSQNVNVKY